MPWRDELLPAQMTRVAVVAPKARLRRVLIEVADAGVFEPDLEGGDVVSPALGVSPEPGSTSELEASLEQHAAAAHLTTRSALLSGWIQSKDLAGLRDRLACCGGAVVSLPPTPGVMAPTAVVDGGAGASVRPLVATYATVPYRDIDPSVFAALIYVAMFGMMFGDVGHGLLLVAAGLLARKPTVRWLAAAQPFWVFLVGAGIAAIGFGLLYGEAFGPTGLVPTLWLAPLEDAQTLLIAGLAVGGALLAATFVLAIINRWRESGLAGALYSSAGIGGALLFVGGGVVLAGIITSASWLLSFGVVVAIVGFVLTFVGLFVAAGKGGAGIGQASIEMFDTVLRLGSNLVSFTRLAAFGLTHAVITSVVWDGTTNLWNRSGPLPVLAAIGLFAAGNLAAFTLGALVAAIQAMRLEYYELFSRLFVVEGRPFRPWHLPINPSEIPCPPS